MKLVPRKRGGGDEETVEQIKVQAEEWVAQTRQGFAEARARHRQALAEAQSALEAERETRAELERALESERKQRAELQRRLEEAEAKPSEAQRGRGQRRTERTPPDGTAAGTERMDRVENWAAAKRLAADGLSQREIALRLGINRRTVARLIAADAPPRYRRAPQGSMLDPLEPLMRAVLRDRPLIDAADMTEVLRTHGYRGSVDLVRRRLRLLRPPS
jgi:Homeodomain-like domain